jgi:phosphate:Na+ symporter
MVGYNPAAPNPALLPFVLAAFHTTFNILNTAILIWFIPQIEAFVCKVITNNNQEEDEFRLKFISSGVLSTPELSILEAKKEISNFATRCHKMFGFVNDLLTTTKDEEFNKLFSRIEKYENITDNMEAEIANYLTKVSEGHLSDESKARITRMMRQIDELESIGDSCYHLARTINRRRKNAKQEYTPEQMEHINAMMVLVENAMENMETMINHPDSQGGHFMKARNIENEINNFRSHLKGKNFEDVNAGKYPYQLGVYYIDYISECEKLGDYIMNVNQASNECAKNR